MSHALINTDFVCCLTSGRACVSFFMVLQGWWVCSKEPALFWSQVWFCRDTGSLFYQLRTQRTHFCCRFLAGSFSSSLVLSVTLRWSPLFQLSGLKSSGHQKRCLFAHSLELYLRRHIPQRCQFFHSVYIYFDVWIVNIFQFLHLTRRPPWNWQPSGFSAGECTFLELYIIIVHNKIVHNTSCAKFGASFSK